MAGPVLYRRSPDVTADAPATRRPEGHGRSRSRSRRANRAHRRRCPALPEVVRERGVLVVLVVAAFASLLTSVYLVTLIS